MANSDYQTTASGPLCTVANLVTSLGYLDTNVIFNSLSEAATALPTVGMGVMIDDEIMKITALFDNHFTADRGCADTIPATHAAGAVIWFYETGFATDRTPYAATEDVSVKLLPFTNSDQVPVASSPPAELKFNFRFARPYPPANFTLNGSPWFGVAAPSIHAAGDSFVMAWKHRDRIVQADQLVGHTSDNIGPETGTTYTIHLYDRVGNLVATRGGVTGSSLGYTFAMAQADLTNFAAAGVESFTFLFCSTRDGLDSSSGYLFPVSIDTGTVSQPLGLGYRLGQYLGGRISGPGTVVPTWPNLHLITVINGQLVAATFDHTFVSTDGGLTFTIAASGGTQDLIGLAPVYAQIGSQRIAIGLNGHASLAEMIVGSDDLSVQPVVYKNDNAVTLWQNEGYPRADGTPIGTGALFSDGSNYFIVGRAGHNTQTPGVFYLYKADTSLNFALQGALTVDPDDPNAVTAGNYGGFSSFWFTPNDPDDAVSGASTLNKVGGRWFLGNDHSIYYSDDAAGLANWRRCATGLGETANNPPINMFDPLFSGSYVIAVKGFDLSNQYTVSVSADSGATWVPQTPTPPNGFPNFYGITGAVMLGPVACVYFDNLQNNTVSQVLKAVAPFTSWSTSDVVGLPSDAVMGGAIVVGGRVLATVGGQIYHSIDGVNFVLSGFPTPPST